MKCLFFFVGGLIFCAGVQLSVNGAQRGFDAAVSTLPILVGIVLMGVAVGLHIYDNWDDRQYVDDYEDHDS